MTKEEKDLLLKDLCARLPYGLMCKSQRFKKRLLIGIDECGCIFKFRNENRETEYGVLDIENWKVRPYLRPMSSMTEEEKKMLWEELDKDMVILETNIDTSIISVYKGRCYRGNPIYHEIDFLNRNHFDWRGLIEKGLALEAPDGMYKN